MKRLLFLSRYHFLSICAIYHFITLLNPLHARSFVHPDAQEHPETLGSWSHPISSNWGPGFLHFMLVDESSTSSAATGLPRNLPLPWRCYLPGNNWAIFAWVVWWPILPQHLGCGVWFDFYLAHQIKVGVSQRYDPMAETIQKNCPLYCKMPTHQPHSGICFDTRPWPLTWMTGNPGKEDSALKEQSEWL